MLNFIKLALVLAVVGGVATAVLAMAEKATKPDIAKQQQQAKIGSLDLVFPGISLKGAKIENLGEKAFAITLADGGKLYAAEGAGLGYNPSVPIVLVAGFKPADGGKGYVVSGWNVIASAETPGLGEKIRDREPAFTWGELASGKSIQQADSRTAFQKQFSGKASSQMEAKKNIDVITGATYSTAGVILALQNAEKNLAASLEPAKTK